MEKQRVVRVVLRSSATVDPAGVASKANWSNYVNIGNLQELDGVEKFYARVNSVTPIIATATSVPALKVEIDQLPQDGWDAGLRGPSRTIATLENTVVPQAGIGAWFIQGNVPYGGFQINRASTNNALWRVNLIGVNGVVVTPTQDWEVHLELAY